MEKERRAQGRGENEEGKRGEGGIEEGIRR
jgi:hypothetical protein